jgi:nucleotide-binding universal stress UspA family protein
MGWHGQPRTHSFSLGSTVDPIIERSPCNLVVLKEGGNHKFSRILVPVAGGPNGGFALEIASILSDKNDGIINAFTVVTDKNKFDIVGFVSEHKQRLQIPSERVLMKAVNADDVIEAILKEAQEYDLVVLGCTRRSMLYRVTQESIPDMIARRCTKSLIMVNEAEGITSWMKRWI